ncbi:MAG TPA: hypothetical protein VK668_09765 [Mucilaginibacter sp.]|nr:hypothetical protein [Mucilaginibacter sp.]
MLDELSKKDKKAAREIIGKGLDRDFKRGLLEFEVILKKWRSESEDDRDCYHRLYESVSQFNKYLKRTYDYMPGSRYLDVLTLQLRDQLIDATELDALSQEPKDYILRLANRE